MNELFNFHQRCEHGIHTATHDQRLDSKDRVTEWIERETCVTPPWERDQLVAQRRAGRSPQQNILSNTCLENDDYDCLCEKIFQIY